MQAEKRDRGRDQQAARHAQAEPRPVDDVSTIQRQKRLSVPPGWPMLRPAIGPAAR